MASEDFCTRLNTLLDAKKVFDLKSLTLKESQFLYDPDFICSFLDFLRESSATVLKEATKDHPDSNMSEARKSNAVQSGQVDQNHLSLQRLQKMSTPKLRDGIATPRSINDFNTSSLNNNFSMSQMYMVTPKQGAPTSIQHDQGRQIKSSHRHKAKPLSLSDFMSPEAGHMQSHNSSRKKLHKSRSQNKKRITPGSEGRQNITLFSGGNSYFSRNDISCSPHLETRPKTSMLSTHDTKSPVNPLYSEASRSISFDIEEEFPKLSTNPIMPSNCKPSRRIKPTTVIAEVKKAPNVLSPVVHTDQDISSNPFTSSISTATANDIDTNIERHLLLRMKNRGFDTKNRRNDSCAEVKNMKTEVKSIEDISPVKKTSLIPDPSHVFDSARINILAEIYSYFINALLVPNIITELQFVMELLTVWSAIQKLNDSMTGSQLCITGSLCNSSESNIEDHAESLSTRNILSTAANCVFFAVQTIQYLVYSGIISILSRSTLSLLAQNNRIQHFLPALSTQLTNLIEKVEQKEDFFNDGLGSQEKLHSLSGVPFEAETDDRSNFTSDKSFHGFRKHRDMFYTIVREFEDKRNDPNFDVQQSLAGKIKNLVEQVKSTATYKPFVRLFVSQMLQGANLCENQSQILITNQSFAKDSFNDSHASKGDLLTSLRHGDPEKYRRLQSRFVTASNSSIQGNRTKDPLAEQCYFYKEFVLIADSYIFNTHLCNELRERISDIETQQVQQILDDLLAETVNFSSISSSLTTMISSIRALGRLFGIITFQPYDTGDSSTPYNSSLLSNPTSSLERSSSRNHELVTVPWVTEYLKSANLSSKQLTPEAEDLIHKLSIIFRNHAFNDKNIITTADIMICLAISSLFEMSNFQDNYFFNVLMKKFPENNYVSKSLKLTSVRNQEMKQEVVMEMQSFDISCSDLVTFSLIYDWYPSLKEIKASIVSCNSGTGKSNQSQQPPRKIKPNTEKKSEETVAQKKNKQLQSTLEEHFFRGQPSSLKRTVAFVAERCASNCVKHIRSIAMLKVCDEAEKMFQERFTQGNANYEVDNYAKIGLVKQVVNEMKVLANDRMHKESNEYCDRAVPQCMKDLASCETADGVLKVATTITRTKALASVHSWLSNRLDELVSVSVKARLIKVSANMKKEEPDKLSVVKDNLEEVISIPSRIKSISSLLQTMKEYAVKLRFTSSASIDCSISEKISELDVISLLTVAFAVLGKDLACSENISSHIGPDKFSSMRQLIKSSQHLRNSLLLITKELATLSDLNYKPKGDKLRTAFVFDLTLACS